MLAAMNGSLCHGPSTFCKKQELVPWRRIGAVTLPYIDHAVRYGKLSIVQ
jgi:hypothetical protein